MYTKIINHQKINLDLGGNEKSQNIIFTYKTVFQITVIFVGFLNTK